MRSILCQQRTELGQSQSCRRLVMPNAMRSFWWNAGTLSLWTGQCRTQLERSMPLRRKSV